MANDNEMLEQKKHIQKLRAAEKAEPSCLVCKKQKKKCICLGAAGGPSSQIDLPDESKAGAILELSPKKTKKITVDDLETKMEIRRLANTIVPFVLPAFILSLKFDRKILSYLLKNDMLLIDNDKAKGELNIELLCNPNTLTAEQRNELNKYILIILNELDNFKKQNEIAAKSFDLEYDKHGNLIALRIALPTSPVPLYDLFIEGLGNKHLLPKENILQQTKGKVEYENTADLFNPKPFFNRPGLTPGNNKKPVEEEKYKPVRPRSVLDGLKPKDC